MQNVQTCKLLQSNIPKLHITPKSDTGDAISKLDVEFSHHVEQKFPCQNSNSPENNMKSAVALFLSAHVIAGGAGGAIVGPSAYVTPSAYVSSPYVGTQQYVGSQQYAVGGSQFLQGFCLSLNPQPDPCY